MKSIKPYDIFKIAQPGTSTCLTIYVNKPSQILSLILEAQRVGNVDLREQEISQLLEPVFNLISNPRWKSSTGTTGIFITQGFAGLMKIPFQTKNLAVVSKSFHVKPLLKWIQREKPFLILQLGSKKATLYQGTMSEVRAIEKFAFTSGSSSVADFKALERQVYRFIKDMNFPLILSGKSNVITNFSKICRYKMKVDKPILSLRGGLSLEALHRQGIAVLEPYFKEQEEYFVEKYWTAKEQNSASASLNQIVSHAIKGEVKHLFINENMNIWGQINYSDGSFSFGSRQLSAQDDDVLDDLAELVLFHGGLITVLPSDRMPESHAASAILKNRSSALDPNTAPLEKGAFRVGQLNQQVTEAHAPLGI